MPSWEMLSATLYLDGIDGEITFRGQLFGASKSVVGEIVFQTGMVGYVESLTDPSYAKQLLVLTYPLIGNYGVGDEKFSSAVVDDTHKSREGFESDRIWPAALIVSRICPEGEHSHWAAVQSLNQWLKKMGVPGLTGIDTRELTKVIREKGTMKARLVIDSDDVSNYPFKDINEENLVSVVSRKTAVTYGSGPLKILAVDCGMKNNQLRCLISRGASVRVVPWDHPIDSDNDYDGLFISNGPGDPATCTALVQRLSNVVRANIESVQPKPVFGICLGHQLLARAIGVATFKLKYGNRGHNQPCTHLDTKRCFITSQNHGYAVDVDSLPSGWVALFRNENDGTNEGIIHENLPMFSVQFHPEHASGPTDTEFLFDIFIEAVDRYRKRSSSLVLRQVIEEYLTYKPFSVIAEQRKVLVLGSGGLSIGQAGEFDYSGAQALKALKEKSIHTVLINPNVATVQTSKGFADRTYFLPVTKEYVTDVIKKERPSGILCTFGGQTALNCAIELYKDGILELYGVEVLGTSIKTIMNTEDREKFKLEIESIGERVAPSCAATSIEGAVKAADELGYPVLVRAAYALGGLGSGFANNKNELEKIVHMAFAYSDQVLIDKSLKGWKEIEYEVVRDAYDNCITVCNMENIDPLGIHTGESLVVAPSQTLTDVEYNRLRTVAIKVIRHLKIIGECNIQYALNPESLEYFIIEVNARLSRSSALASKATGYPLAYVAARLALGERLPVIRNSVTEKTTACFEPSLDYCVVKIPRWDLGKFARVSNKIGSSMKSVGEVMSIGRSFEEALQKAFRMVNENVDGFSPFVFTRPPSDEDFEQPTDKRMFAIAAALYNKTYDVEKLHELTSIDRWFLYRMNNIIELYRDLGKYTCSTLPHSVMLEAKQTGFADKQIARVTSSTEGAIRKRRKELGVVAWVKQIDTVSAEWPAATNYLYITYNGSSNDVDFNIKNGVIVLGSGVYRIGSSVEFDACCVGCVRELKKLGYSPITINCNPETVSTDYDICDRLYFEEISFEAVIDIYEAEHPKGIILAFGGQAPNNIAMSLVRASSELNINIFGTSPSDIDNAEDRFKFSRLLDSLKISQPQWKKTDDIERAVQFCEEVGYPCLIRPSYVLSGAAMNVAHDKDDLLTFLKHAAIVAKDHPVVVSKFIREAKEIDVDAVAYNGRVLLMAVSEHVENAGIHSGDATLVTPPQDLNYVTIERIKDIAVRIGAALNVNGPFNMQLIAKSNELKVIECNLRASRSFPFVSKTLDFDFVALATRCMLASDNPQLKSALKPVDLLMGKDRVGVKVAQFSFSRLAGADVMLGVEMTSTGEVACFGRNQYEAYLKALLSTGFVMPKHRIFLSFGGYHAKTRMLNSVRTLASLGFELLASKGTADYLQSNGISCRTVEWIDEEGAMESNEKTSTGGCENLAELLAKRHIDLMINLPIRGSGAYRVSPFSTRGYKSRRMAIDNGIPLITDIKCAKLFVEALRTVGPHPQMSSQIDSISSHTLKRLPGFIDIHTHMREPGGEYKETWESGTSAALAGGITMVLAMPNTSPAVTDAESFAVVESCASKGAVTDYGIYVGGTSTNMDSVKQLADKAVALKLYLNETFTTMRMDSLSDWISHFESFPTNRPIVCHAEKQTMAAVLALSQLYNRGVHIAHVSTSDEILLIREAKKKGWQVTCEVCPHHLFLTADSDLGEGWKEVRPRLATNADVEALWNNMEYIDCFATDHAPHIRQEKERDHLPGFPSIEYILPLLLTAVSQKRLTMEQLIDRLYTNPKRIFDLPEQKDTYIEVNLTEEWTIPENGGLSRSQWTPYAGMKVKGRVETVVIRGEEAFIDGRVIVRPGFGKNIRFPNDGFVKDQGEELLRKHEDAFKTVMNELVRKGSTVSLKPARSGNLQNSHRSGSPKSPTEELPSPLNAITPEDRPFRKQHLISVNNLTKKMVNDVLELADRYRADIDRHHPIHDVLKGFLMASMFYEVSTRTASSFAAAMQRLGGSVIYMDSETSSVKKGETLEDSVRIMSNYADIIVLRHPEVGAASRAAAATQVPVINAGDGTGQHPTQALLDIFTIRSEIGTVNNITIAMVGDLANGRTVHSLARLLCVYTGITFHYVSPTKYLGMPEAVIDYVGQRGFKQVLFTDLKKGITDVDIIYMTRVQKERFASEAEYNAVQGKFVLTQKLLNEVSRTQDGISIGRQRQLPIVMHPLPRIGEISPELDNDERAAYFRQAKNGMYVRMAILALICDRQ